MCDNNQLRPHKTRLGGILKRGRENGNKKSNVISSYAFRISFSNIECEKLFRFGTNLFWLQPIDECDNKSIFTSGFVH